MKKTVWLLLDDRMGSVGQARGVGQALNAEKFEIIEKKIAYNRFGVVPNCLLGSSLLALTPESRAGLKDPFPDLVVSASRRTAPVAKWIKKKSQNQTKIIQLMLVDGCLKNFDLVFVSEHDRPKKGKTNFIYVVGSPHRITEKSLKEASDLWQKEFESLPKPLTAVIVGGEVKGRVFSEANAKLLGQEIKKVKAQDKGSILITSSKRTGPKAEDALMKEIKDIPSFKYLWGTSGANPYMGFLACADNIIVTGDSVSMCSEACGTGKPVYVFEGKDWLPGKHQRFAKSLYSGGYAKPLGSAEFTPKAKLNATLDIVQAIESLF